jgi:Flp pilus assembly protein TadG
MTPARKSWRRDERGVAAMEFAFIAPLMVLLYFALAELTSAIMANGRAAHVASVVGDLVSQEGGTLTNSQLDNIFGIGDAIMKPFPTTTMKYRITSVRADANGVPQVTWSYEKGMTHLTGKATEFPTGLLATGESVITSEVQYTYTSPIQQVIPKPLTFSTKYYIKPRRVTEVAYTP